MRKFGLLFGLLFSFLLQANAQSADSVQAEVLLKATEESEQWQRNLQLTKEQFKQLKEANIQRTDLLDNARKKYKYELELRDQAIQQLEAQFDALFKEILDAKQFAGYLELQGRNVSEIIADKGSGQPENSNNSDQAQPEKKSAVSLSGEKPAEKDKE